MQRNDSSGILPETENGNKSSSSGSKTYRFTCKGCKKGFDNQCLHKDHERNRCDVLKAERERENGASSSPQVAQLPKSNTPSTSIPKGKKRKPEATTSAKTQKNTVKAEGKKRRKKLKLSDDETASKLIQSDAEESENTASSSPPAAKLPKESSAASVSTPKDKKSKSEAKTPAKIQNTEKAELSTETVVVEKAEAQKPRKRHENDASSSPKAAKVPKSSAPSVSTPKKRKSEAKTLNKTEVVKAEVKKRQKTSRLADDGDFAKLIQANDENASSSLTQAFKPGFKVVTDADHSPRVTEKVETSCSTTASSPKRGDKIKKSSSKNSSKKKKPSSTLSSVGDTPPTSGVEETIHSTIGKRKRSNTRHSSVNSKKKDLKSDSDECTLDTPPPETAGANDEVNGLPEAGEKTKKDESCFQSLIDAESAKNGTTDFEFEQPSDDEVSTSAKEESCFKSLIDAETLVAEKNETTDFEPPTEDVGSTPAPSRSVTRKPTDPSWKPPSTSKPHPCLYCSKRFTSLYLLCQHSRKCKQVYGRSVGRKSTRPNMNDLDLSTPYDKIYRKPLPKKRSPPVGKKSASSSRVKTKTAVAKTKSSIPKKSPSEAATIGKVLPTKDRFTCGKCNKGFSVQCIFKKHTYECQKGSQK